MRLKDHVDLAKAALPGCGQRGLDFGGMVAVVVDHANASDLAAQLETTVDTAKVFQRGVDVFDAEVQADADRNCGRGVENVVQSGHMQHEFAEILTAVAHRDVTQRAMFARLGYDRTRLDEEVGSATSAISHHPTLHLGQQFAQDRVVVAGNDHAIEGNPVHEIEEGLFDVTHVAVAVHMLAVNVGDDGENWRKLQKGAIAFVGFGDEVLRLPQAGVGAHGVDSSADHDGRVEAAGGENSCNHGGGRGFAM